MVLDPNFDFGHSRSRLHVIWTLSNAKRFQHRVSSTRSLSRTLGWGQALSWSRGHPTPHGGPVQPAENPRSFSSPAPVALWGHVGGGAASNPLVETVGKITSVSHWNASCVATTLRRRQWYWTGRGEGGGQRSQKQPRDSHHWTFQYGPPFHRWFRQNSDTVNLSFLLPCPFLNPRPCPPHPPREQCFVNHDFYALYFCLAWHALSVF